MGQDGCVCVQADAWRARMQAGTQQHPQFSGLGTSQPPSVSMIASPGSSVALRLLFQHLLVWCNLKCLFMSCNNVTQAFIHQDTGTRAKIHVLKSIAHGESEGDRAAWCTSLLI